MPGTENRRLCAEPPPLLDSVVRFLVWAGVISSLLAPLIGIALIWNSPAFSPFGGGGEPNYQELQRRLIETRTWKGGIAAGGDARALMREANRLRELTAYDGEAKTTASTLQVIVVRLIDGHGASQRSPERVGYRTIGLDLTAASRTATLIIADAPILWDVAANAQAARARLALEGTAPFDVAHAAAGLLAGFRIESFGASNVTRPNDALSQGSAGARRYCGALALWVRHFGLSLADTTATFIENPKSIRVSDRGVEQDGRELVGRTPFATCPTNTRLR